MTMTRTNAERIARATELTLTSAAPLWPGLVIETVPELARQRLEAVLLPKLEAMDAERLATVDAILWDDG